jgi:hypothetical protein
MSFYDVMLILTYLHLDNKEPFELQPPNKWTVETLEALKIEFSDVSHDVMFPTRQLSDKATKVLEDLKYLDVAFLLSYENRSRSARSSLSCHSVDDSGRPGNEYSHDGDDSNSKPSGDVTENNCLDYMKHPLCKALFIMDKYSHLESPVDSFVFQLLCHLGFNDNWLYIFPQLPLKLRSNKRSITSKPDFTLMDVISFYRAVVVEDKKTDERDWSGAEAQLVAEAVSAQQSNVVKEHSRPSKRTRSPATSEENTIMGIRVCGFYFTFYRIPYSQPLIYSVLNEVVASDTTIVQRCQHTGYDFRDAGGREVIVSLLDSLLYQFTHDGEQAKRRLS